MLGGGWGVARYRPVDMLALPRPAAGPASGQVGETFRLCHVIVAGRGLAISRRVGREHGPVDFYIAAICFPIVFLGELPDKTMFASLILATRGKPAQVWLGAAAAFTVHVAIAVTAGVALFSFIPRRYLELVVAVLFAAGAIYAWVEGSRNREERAPAGPSSRGAVLTAFTVIFVAEWGDLTQILTANLAAKYHAPLAVGVGAVLALWSVAAIAVIGGQTLLRFVKVATIRKVTAVVLVALAVYTAWSAFR